jgi:hypothetical protein
MVTSGMLRGVILTRATRRNIPEDTILHSHRRENLKSYILLQTELNVFHISKVLLLLMSGIKENVKT